MHILPLAPEDITAVVELILRNYDEVMVAHHSRAILAKCRAEISPEALERQARWKHILVVRENGRTVATGSIANFGTPETPRYCVSQCYVLPDLQGRGIGAALMEELLAYVRTKGVQICHVPSSRNAVGFYARFGFVMDENQPDHADEITWMTLRL